MPDIYRAWSSRPRSIRRSRASSSIGYSPRNMSSRCRDNPAPAVRCIVVLGALWFAVAPSLLRGQARAAAGKTYDEILDTYVRDGLVYYRALKLERAKFDAYVGTLAGASIESAPRDEQLAFWLNAYNAIVLQTVIDHYPIAQRTSQYPPHSVRQVPGAFERLPHRVAGRTLTLDQIEQTVLPTFHDPRVYLALGRGSVGGGRLRSEALAPSRLEAQLTEGANGCAGRSEGIQIDRQNNRVVVSAIFSWREQEFAAAHRGLGAPGPADPSPTQPTP